jgi:hypothetical protein
MRPHTLRPSRSIPVPIEANLHRLLELVSRKPDFSASFAQARALLETLPLSTEDFGVACNRLANAQRYLESGERGAACFELRLLLKHLQG